MCDHESYNTAYHQCKSWCEDIATRLECCLNLDDSVTSVESKLSQLNDLSSQCESEGVFYIQRVRDDVAVVLPSTSADGRSAINEAVSELMTYWEALVNKISLAHDKTEASLASYNEFTASVSKLLQQLNDAEEQHNQLLTLQSTLAEKMSLAQRSRVCFVLCDDFTVCSV